MNEVEGETPEPGPSSWPRIELRNWGIRHGRRRLLDDITLEAEGPGTVVLMGPSGTGKSTLLNAIAGLQAARAQQWGEILIQGQAPSSRTAALVHQHPRDLASTVYACLAAPLRQLQPLSTMELRHRVIERLQQLELPALCEQLDTPLVQLPRALARLTLIARAALGPAPILLLDEPTTDLDPVGAELILALIQRLADTRLCVISLHHQGHARRLGSHLVLLAGGQIQVQASNHAFFANSDQHPVLAQFLRTGSCSVPSLDALPEELEPEPSAVASTEAEPAPATAATATIADSIVPLEATEPAPRAMHGAGIQGPNGFHWLVPGQFAGCPMPGVMLPIRHDLQLLRNVGVTVLINLTEQPMHDPEIAEFGIRSIHMGVEDRNAPPVMWMKMLLVRIERLLAEGEVVAVHCRAGLGRTGTALASWLIAQGLTAEEALRRIRAIEPGFVQSTVQERFLVELEENLLIRVRPH